jgi:hypothetical protein
MIILDQWQKDVLAHKGNLLLCTGRRVGKTYIMARKAIDRMMEKKTKIIIFSLTEEQSMLILAMAKEYCREAYPSEMKRRNTDTNKKTLTLKNGSIMRCRPAGDTGDSGRGFEADVVIIDEAARMGKLFWIAVLPIMLMQAGERWLASTPFGKQGYFWERFNEAHNLNDPQAEYTVFYETTENVVKIRAITNEWTEERREKILRILEQDKKNMSRLEYGQEYLGLFLEDLQQFFPDELINKCQRAKRPGRIDPNKDYFMGQDIARMGEDETSTEIGYFEGDNLIQVENLVSKHTYLTDTFKSNLELDKIYDFSKMLIDDEGIGIGVFDMMMDSELKYKTIGINNSKRVIDKDGKEKGILKTELYYLLRTMMERGEIELLEDESIFQSLKSVQYEYDFDIKGNPRIKIHGNYTHIAEGLTRLAWAKKYKHLNFKVYSIKV